MIVLRSRLAMAGKKNMFNLIKTFTEQSYNTNCYTAVMKKVVLLSAEETKEECCVIGELKVEQEHCNPGGKLHGGLIATLIDNFTTYTVLKDLNSLPGVSMDIHVSYLKGASIGEDVLIEARSIKVGNMISFLGCELRNKQDGTVYAKGYQSMFMNLKNKSN